MILNYFVASFALVGAIICIIYGIKVWRLDKGFAIIDFMLALLDLFLMAVWLGWMT